MHDRTSPISPALFAEVSIVSPVSLSVLCSQCLRPAQYDPVVSDNQTAPQMDLSGNTSHIGAAHLTGSQCRKKNPYVGYFLVPQRSMTCLQNCFNFTNCHAVHVCDCCFSFTFFFLYLAACRVVRRLCVMWKLRSQCRLAVADATWIGLKYLWKQ